jgi:hypothetical protein
MRLFMVLACIVAAVEGVSDQAALSFENLSDQEESVGGAGSLPPRLDAETSGRDGGVIITPNDITFSGFGDGAAVDISSQNVNGFASYTDGFDSYGFASDTDGGEPTPERTAHPDNSAHSGSGSGSGGEHVGEHGDIVQTVVHDHDGASVTTTTADDGTVTETHEDGSTTVDEPAPGGGDDGSTHTELSDGASVDVTHPEGGVSVVVDHEADSTTEITTNNADGTSSEEIVEADGTSLSPAGSETVVLGDASDTSTEDRGGGRGGKKVTVSGAADEHAGEPAPERTAHPDDSAHSGSASTESGGDGSGVDISPQNVGEHGDIVQTVVHDHDGASVTTTTADDGTVTETHEDGSTTVDEPTAATAAGGASAATTAHAKTVVEGNGFGLSNAGSGYTVGDTIKLGEGVAGWDTAAVVRVSVVDANGGILSVELVSGGHFTGEDGTGSYNLDLPSAALLMKAATSHAERSKDTQAKALSSNPSSTLYLGLSLGTLAALVVVVVTMKRRAVTAAATSAAAADGDRTCPALADEAGTTALADEAGTMSMMPVADFL